MATAEHLITQVVTGATPLDGITMDVETSNNQADIPAIPGPTELVRCRDSATITRTTSTETAREDLKEINTTDVDVIMVVRRDNLKTQESLISDVLRPVSWEEMLLASRSSNIHIHTVIIYLITSIYHTYHNKIF